VIYFYYCISVCGAVTVTEQVFDTSMLPAKNVREGEKYLSMMFI